MREPALSTTSVLSGNLMRVCEPSGASTTICANWSFKSWAPCR